MLPHLSQSPDDPVFVQDPYPFYQRARSLGDLVHWTEYDMPMAVSHRAVSALLRDRRLGRAAPEGMAPPVLDHLTAFYGIESNSMLELEPPRHTRLRKLVLHAFTSRSIARLAPTIRQLSETLADALPRGPVDILKSYCTPLPVLTIARLLGVPADDADTLLAWSHAMVGMYQSGRSRDAENAAEAATRAFTAWLAPQIAARRAAPRDDLLSDLVRAETEGARLTADELTATTILLLNAGHEATVHTLGNAIAACLTHGHRPTAETAPATVEETLRHDPPLHLFTRWVYEDCTLFDRTFARGDRVGLLLAAAGRDAAVFPAPARFDPARSPGPHLAFGAGLHFCVGAPLARLELEIGLETLFRRHPALALAAPPRYADIYHFHGLDRLICTTS